MRFDIDKHEQWLNNEHCSLNVKRSTNGFISTGKGASAMENKKSISIFVGIIAVLVVVAAAIGIASINMKNEFEFTTIYGDVVKMYGGGIYRMHTVAQVYQVIPHDMVNLFLAVPALLISFFSREKAFSRPGCFLWQSRFTLCLPMEFIRFMQCTTGSTFAMWPSWA